MPQITIYLDDEVLALVKAAAQKTGVSKSKWIADAVRLRTRREWPASVLALVGAWPDFPTTEEIRELQSTDVSREKM